MSDSAITKTVSKTSRQAWRVREFCEALGISRSHLYQVMKRGELRTVTLGGRRLVPDSERARLLGELQNAGA
jgi:excisionase family DNA binding protein